MSTKFTMTIILQGSGEFDLQADSMPVTTDPEFKILPAVMFAGNEMKDLDDEERKTVARILSYNVVHRALEALKIPGVTTGVPAPIPLDTPPGERS